MSKTALITGASGLLGRDVVKAFERKGWKVVGTALKNTNPPSIVKLDLENGEELVTVLDEVKPDVIVHCAANRFPDSVAANPAAATAINATATATLASLTFTRGILLLYISTDYVFPGTPGDAPYYPDSPTAPPNAYGRTKRDGEVAVVTNTGGDGAASGEGGEQSVLGVVVRVPLLYGSAGEGQSRSAVHALVDAVYGAQKVAAGAAKIKVDDYALRYPTCTEDVGRVLVDVATLYRGQGGGRTTLPRIVQFSAEQRFTKFEMCEALAGILGMGVEGLERHDPSKEDAAGGTARPYDCKLDTGTLRELGVSVNCVDFVAWWKRELRAFRH